MNKGIVYLIQPTELLQTNRYKVGCSNKPTLERCIKGYKKGSRYLLIMECNNPLILERNIKDYFNSKYSLIAGAEYFEGNEEEMITDFIMKYQEYKSYQFNSMDIDEEFMDGGSSAISSIDPTPPEIPVNATYSKITKFNYCDILIGSNDISTTGFDKNMTEREIIDLAIQHQCPIIVKCGKGKWYLKGHGKTADQLKSLIERNINETKYKTRYVLLLE